MWLKNRKVRLVGMALVLVPLVAVFLVANGQAKGKKHEKGDGWLGVYIQNIDKDLQESEDLPSDDGVLVTRVVEDSPAAEAGLKRGDVILSFDGKDVRSVRRLTRMIERSDPDEEKTLVILHNGKKKNLTVTLGEREEVESDVFSGDFDDDGDFAFRVPDVPPLPEVYSFSLGQVSTSRIGVSLYEMSDQLAKHFGAEDGGALINEVVKDGPADKAGLEAGDVIVKIDGKPVDDIDDIRDAIQEKDKGETVTVTVLRDGNEERTVDVTVEESDTWSGVGPPRFFEFKTPRAGARRWRQHGNERRDAMRKYRRMMRDDLQEQIEELRDQIRELRQSINEKGL